MNKTRLEGFSDGVLAVIITIMVLDLHIPRGQQLSALEPMLPVFYCYVLSFVFVGIYWNNHHHMLHAAKRVSGGVLWANLHLLFWLSLLPFVTGWMGENSFGVIPTALYGFVVLMAGTAYGILCRALIALEGSESLLGKALAKDRKGRISVVLYAVAIPLAFASRWAALSIYILVELMWLIPDRRIERTMASHADE
jgi:uncharacterized membrane protein